MSNVLQLGRVGDLQAGLVLGQDLHEGPELQPPLLFGNPVPANGRQQGESSDSGVPLSCPPFLPLQ